MTWYATLDQNFIRQLLVQYVHNRSKNLKVFVSSNVVKHGQRPWNGRRDDYI